MSNTVRFDDIKKRVRQVLNLSLSPQDDRPELFIVRNLYGRLRLVISESDECARHDNEWLRRAARDICEALGSRSRASDTRILPVNSSLIESLKKQSVELVPSVYWLDRSISTELWRTINSSPRTSNVQRFALYSVKGGVGRSTTAVVLSRYLADRGERVLVVDLDLESPGLSAMLSDEYQPRYGITDWLVEDLIGQGNELLDDLSAKPQWRNEFVGDVRVVPAWGRDPGEYLAKLGRVYVDTERSWNERVQTLIETLENRYGSTITILESRSGLHDLAAATVTDLSANVLMFVVDSSSTWTGYRVLFEHWKEYNLSASIREKLVLVSALTPPVKSKEYIDLLRERAWELFREHLYDNVSPTDDWQQDRFSFDRSEADAPHDPLPVYWDNGLGTGASLANLPDLAVQTAYEEFWKRFEYLFLTEEGVS